MTPDRKGQILQFCRVYLPELCGSSRLWNTSFWYEIESRPFRLFCGESDRELDELESNKSVSMV